ncbi:frizzled-4 [Venturia canescens]|uniref:frizzled-4 n=1 Tax=Venturia canescens TaxID=32260 RepID=UPI001C9C58AE|nr:frizzled-4 [Venturia canescens]
MCWLPVFVVVLVVRSAWLIVEGACEPIRIEMCRGLGYNVTTMPNLVGHEIQGDADFTLQTFGPLIQYGCSAQLHLFLCSVYAPMCTEKVSSPIGPCRGLCEQVRARCYPVLQGFGFPWPAALNCSKFPPENNHQHMCMEGPGEPGPVNPIQAIGGGNGPWGCSLYAKSGRYIFLNRSGRCAPACEADILWSQRDKRLTEAWMVALVTLCLISALAGIFTFLRPRYNQPTIVSTGESAIACVAFCHAAVGIGFVIRLAAGRIAVACTSAVPLHSPDQVAVLAQQQQQQQYLTQDGLGNPYCAVVFLLLYYFGNAASVWWVVLSGWWCIVARKWKRSSRSSNLKEDGGFGLQQGFATVGAVAAWGFPAAHTIAVLVTRDVDADELTGSCLVGQQSTRSLLLLVLGPQLVYLILGTMFILIGATGLLLHRDSDPVMPGLIVNSSQHTNPLVRNRDASKSPADIYKRQKSLVTRIGVFACFYTFVMICLTGTLLYEWWGRDSWLRAPEPSSGPKVPSRPLLPFFIFRLIVSLGGGAVAAAWIWWPKFSDVCKKLTTCNQPPYKCHPHAATLPVLHCYSSPGSTSPTNHHRQQLHHLSHFTNQPQQTSPGSHISHQHPSVKNSQITLPQVSPPPPPPPPLARSLSGRTTPRKKHSRKYRKQYHSGSETQV